MHLKDTLSARISEVFNHFEDQPWQDPNFYKNYLAQTFYYVSYSTRLLCLSGGSVGIDKKGWDYHNRCIQHIREEFNHHLMAKKDLENMGSSLEKYAELPSTKTFYQLQFHKIQNESPYALLGYILFLEGMATLAKPVIGRLTELYGKKCCTFLGAHYELDSGDDGHYEKAIEQIESLGEADKKACLDSFFQSADCFLSMMQACGNSKASQKTAA